MKRAGIFPIVTSLEDGNGMKKQGHGRKDIDMAGRWAVYILFIHHLMKGTT
jgi:hypothetical protein